MVGAAEIQEGFQASSFADVSTHLSAFIRLNACTTFLYASSSVFSLSSKMFLKCTPTPGIRYGDINNTFF